MTDAEINIADQLFELDVEQAQEILDAFLRIEAATFETLTIPTIDLDYSSDSIIRVAHFVLDEIKTGNIDKEQRSLWFTRLGYYFGEALRRGKPGLAWGLGNPEYAFANHPVVLGFANAEEAPVISICKNMIEAVEEGLSLPVRIANCVRTWFETPVQA